MKVAAVAIHTSMRGYNPEAAGVAADLRAPMGPSESVLARVDPILATPIHLSDDAVRSLVDFVRHGLLDRRAMPENLQKLIPRELASGFPVLVFE